METEATIPSEPASPGSGEAAARAGTDLVSASGRRIFLPDFELGTSLTAEQVAFLDRWGFIRFRRFAGPELVRELRADVEAVDRQLVAEGRAQVNGVPLIIGTRADGGRYVQRMCFTSTFGARLHAFLQDPRFQAILDVAGPGYRIGERERDGLVVNHYRNEAGSSYERLGWHTDSLRDVFYFEKPRRYLNVGFYLDDSPLSKGGVRVLPGSHEQSLWSMLTRKWHFIDDAPDPDEIAIEAEAGDLTIHDGRLWHRVARATATGDASQRRVMYLPLMEGPLKLKDESSSTPFYFRLRKLAGY